MEFARTLVPTFHGPLLAHTLPAGTPVLLASANDFETYGKFCARPVPGIGWNDTELEQLAAEQAVHVYHHQAEGLGFPELPTGNFLVRVQGWVMLQKVEAGLYRVEVKNGYADFYKRRGRKCIVRHHACDLRFNDTRLGDLNRIIYEGPADKATQDALDAIQPQLTYGQDLTYDAGRGERKQVTIIGVDNLSKRYLVHNTAGSQNFIMRHAFGLLEKAVREGFYQLA